MEPLYRLGIGDRWAILQGPLKDQASVPVAPDLRLPAWSDHSKVPWRQLAHSGVNRIRHRNVAEPQVERESVPIHRAGEARVRPQRLQLRSKEEGRAHISVIKRFLT